MYLSAGREVEYYIPGIMPHPKQRPLTSPLDSAVMTRIERRRLPTMPEAPLEGGASVRGKSFGELYEEEPGP